MRANQPTKHLPEQLIPYQFKPGQSGNPNGRPKVKVISEYVREKLADIDPKTGKPVGELIAEKMIMQSIEGLNDARNTVLDRTEGKVIQTHQIDRNEIRLTGTLEDMLKVRQLYLDSMGVKDDTSQDVVVDVDSQDIVKCDSDDKG